MTERTLKKTDKKQHGQVFLTLSLVSVAYNYLVDWLHDHGWEQGATAFLVVGGVAYTILVPAIVFRWTVYTLADLVIIFAGSGWPMITGHWIRHQRTQALESEALERDRRIKSNGR